MDKSKISPTEVIQVSNVEDEDILRIIVTTNQDDDQREAVDDEIPDC